MKGPHTEVRGYFNNLSLDGCSGLIAVMILWSWNVMAICYSLARNTTVGTSSGKVVGGRTRQTCSYWEFRHACWRLHGSIYLIARIRYR